jgi:hypothetical protein
MFSVVFVIVVKIIKYNYEDFKDEQLALSSFTFMWHGLLIISLLNFWNK